MQGGGKFSHGREPLAGTQLACTDKTVNCRSNPSWIGVFDGFSHPLND
jgi:hypothetical protein